MFTVPLALLLALLVGTYALLRKDAGQRVRFLIRAAVGLDLVAGAFMLLFASGELFADASAATAWTLTALWLLPAIACSAWALWRPASFRYGAWTLVALLAAAATYAVARADWWRDFVNHNGPVLGVACLAASLPLALWGLRQPRMAGIALLVVGAVAMSFGPSVSGEALAAPAIVSGGALLIATYLRSTTSSRT